MNRFEQLKAGGLPVLRSKAKTAIRIVASWLNYIWAVPVLLVIYIIRPVILIRFAALNNSRIGHITIDASYYLATLPKNSKLPWTYHWFTNSGESCNEQWSKMVERKLYVRWWVRYLMTLNKLFSGGTRHSVPTLARSRAVDGLFQKNIPHFTFLSGEDEEATAWLKKRGWKPGESFVCLLVRDSAYLAKNLSLSGDQVGAKKWDYHNYRDTDIDTYNAGIQCLLSQGKWVIRMSKTVAKSLSISHPRLIDYHLADDKSDLLDIWLSIHCDQFISTSSGIDNLPIAYGKPPLLFVNAMPLAMLYSWHEMVWTPKHLVWRKTGKYLNLREQLKHHYITSQEYDAAGIDVVDLSSQEILETFLEFNQRLNGTWVETSDDVIRQRKFWDTLKADEEVFKKYHGWIHPKARVGAHFLRKMGDAFFENQ